MTQQNSYGSESSFCTPELAVRLAEQIVRRFRPRRALVLGQGDEPLVESLRALGVDARESGDERCDLVICTDTFDGLSSEEIDSKIAYICRMGDEALFASNHLNETFARHGYLPDENADVTFLAQNALLFRKQGAMRITFVSPSSEISGGVRIIYDEARRLSAMGHIVTVASLDPYPIDWMELPESLRFVHTPAEPAQFVEALPDADALIATLYTTGSLVTQAPASKGRKFYLVQHYESMWAGHPDDVDPTYDEMPLAKMGVSLWLQDLMKSRFGEDCAIVHNIVDFIGAADEVRERDPNSPLRIGMLYHGLGWKGIPDGLAAFEAVKERYPDAQLVLYGVQRPANLPEHCTEFHVSPTREELVEILKSLDVFISPSLAEGFGMPCLEAMCCGVPIVLTDSGGCRDYATPETALVSPAGDAPALGDNLVRICEDADLRRRLAEAGLKKSAEFTGERSARDMEAILRRETSKPSGKLSILYVSAGFRWADAYIDPYLIRAFRELGHEVNVFEPRPRDWEWERQFVTLDMLTPDFRERYNAGAGRLPKELPEEVRRLKPDLVFFNHGLMIPSEILVELRKIGVPTAVWMLDEPQELKISASRGRLFDYVFLQDKASLAYHLKNGNPYTYFMPHGLDPLSHHLPSPDEKLDDSERSDVLLVGTGYPRRRKIVQELGRLGRDVLVVGRMWQGVESPNIRVLNKITSFDEAARLYRGANVVVNIHRGRYDFASTRDVPEPASPNGSFFYIAGCGPLQVVESGFGGADEFLMPGRHYIECSSIEDMIEKIGYYLDHPSERERIADDAADTVHRYHTYAHRLRDALAVIGRPKIHRRVYGIGKKDWSSTVALQSVVVVSQGDLQSLNNCLSVLGRSLTDPCDLLVVHPPCESVAKWLDEKRVPHREVEASRGLTGLLNEGAEATEGEYITFLHESALATPNFSRRLVAGLEKDEQMAIVGPALTFSEGPQEVYATCETPAELQECARTLYLKEKGHLDTISVVDYACFTVRRSALHSVGGFDERFPSNTLELSDFCHRARLMGWNVGWTRAALVHRDVDSRPASPADRLRAEEMYARKWSETPKLAADSRRRHEPPMIVRPYSTPQDLEKIEVAVDEGSIRGVPLVSIVILAHNQVEFTRKCIESIRRNTQSDYELIVVNNGSTDGTKEYLATVEDAKVITCDYNLGYAAGNNAGIAEASGDYIVLMNNDVVVTPGWLDILLRHAERNPRVGLIGPVSNCVSGLQQVKNVSYETSSLEGLEEFARRHSEGHYGESESHWRMVGFCVMIRRSVIDAIGGLDPRFGLGNFEDDDFCVRAAIAGYRCEIARDCFVHHYGSATFSGESIDRDRLIVANWEIFKQKWGLPTDLLLGAPYDMTWVLRQRFNPRRHYCSLWRDTARTERWFVAPDWNDPVAWQSIVEQYVRSFRPSDESLLMIYAGRLTDSTAEDAYERVGRFLEGFSITEEDMPDIEITDALPDATVTRVFMSGGSLDDTLRRGFAGRCVEIDALLVAA